MRWLPEYGVGIIAFGNLTYTGWGGTCRRRRSSCSRKTGGLQPRTIAAVTGADRRARRGVAARRASGTTPLADRIAAENLFLDRSSSDRRKAEIEALRAQRRRLHGRDGLRSRRERAARRMDDDLRARRSCGWRSRWRRRCRRRCSSCQPVRWRSSGRPSRPARSRKWRRWDERRRTGAPRLRWAPCGARRRRVDLRRAAAAAYDVILRPTAETDSLCRLQNRPDVFGRFARVATICRTAMRVAS